MLYDIILCHFMLNYVIVYHITRAYTIYRLHQEVERLRAGEGLAEGDDEGRVGHHEDGPSY